MVVAVAEESRGAEHARPWIDQAKSSYWQLIDTDHRLSDLYNLVNVPQAVWIDEEGRIVRPPETAGSTDHFRRMDLQTRTMSPEDQAERLAARQVYLDAVRAWVNTGRYALPAGEAHRCYGRSGIGKQPGLEGRIVPGAGHDARTIAGADILLIGLDQSIECCWINIALVDEKRFQRPYLERHAGEAMTMIIVIITMIATGHRRLSFSRPWHGGALGGEHPAGLNDRRAPHHQRR